MWSERNVLYSRTTITQILLFFLCFIFALQLVFTTSSIPLDYLNVLIHEAGHMLLVGFGESMYIAGGTIFQLTIPALTVGYTYLMKRKFGTALSGFWLGDNLINISLYINDARERKLDLTGVHHDWNWLLTNSDLLNYSTIISAFVFALGVLALFASLIIMYTIILLRFHEYYLKSGKMATSKV